MAPQDSIRDKWQAVARRIADNYSACELKWSLFYSAIASSNPAVIKPYPAQYLDPSSNELRLEYLQETARQVPTFSDIAETPPNDLPDSDVIDLLFWTLNKEPSLSPVTPANYPVRLQNALASKPTRQWPQFVFEVTSNPESNGEKRFQNHKDQFGRISDFAFHGSKLESFFSILNFGLAQHLCKRDLYGDGAYLSTSMDVALNFSVKGSGWPKSQLFADHYSVLALCEYVPNPLYIRNNPKKVPTSYVILTNNDVVRLRYLLIFSKPVRKMNGIQEKSQWSTSTKILLGVILYLLLLGLVGYFNSGSFLRHQFWSFWNE